MKKNKLIIGGIIVIAIVVAGIFIILKEPEVPVVNDVIDPIIEEVVAPKVILTGNLETMSLNIRQGYIATFNIYHKGELVGISTTKRIEENKIKSEEVVTIDGVREKLTVIFEHDVDFKVQRIDLRWVDIEAVVIFDHQRSETVVKANGTDNGFEKIEILRIRQNPDAFERIDIQALEIGWRQEFPVTEIISIDPKIEVDQGAIIVEVIDQKTVTVPAGTFDVLKIRTEIEIMEIYMDYYVTLEGRLVKYVNLMENRAFKLKSYSPVEQEILIPK